MIGAAKQGHGVSYPKDDKHNYLICSALVADTARRVPTGLRIF